MAPSDENKEDKPRRNKLHLVSEARPIPEKGLIGDELYAIRDADAWIKAVVDDSAREKPGADEIDEHRNGRVLFIDGPRGAGKTSLLLTLLRRWATDPKDSGKYGSLDYHASLHIFLPVLDFDPLPHGMPLHGWLLEPWRKKAQESDKISGDSYDLSEQFAELFERAVIGWTPVPANGKGVVEKALTYQHHTEGWLETSERWRKFVGAMVCRSHGCTKKDCKHPHRRVFVVAIDDVDLQVEHLPQLLHAIRLFHHPNVAYLLTGNYEHLRFVLLRDYVRRHWQQSDRHERHVPWSEIQAHSKRLRDAFLEKALPPHTQLTLKHLSFQNVLTMLVSEGPGADKRQVEALLEPSVLGSISNDIREFKLVTARQAQRAVETLLAGPREDKTSGSPPERSSAAYRALEFVADLCGTTLDPRTNATMQASFMLRGNLTTRFGDVRKFWEGRNRTTVLLAERPRFVLYRHDVEPDDEERAHQALVIQSIVEQDKARAPALAWEPDAGVLATEVRWDSKVAGIEGRSLFHWPWLVRPKTAEIIALESIVEDVVGVADGSTQAALTTDMVCIWLSQSITWCYARDDRMSHLGGRQLKAWKDGRKRWLALGKRPSLDEIASALENLSKCGDELSYEAKYWVRQVLVMTAPYFGLPESVAVALQRKLVALSELKSTQEEVKKEERVIVKNAIIVLRTPAERISRDPWDEKDDPSSKDYDDAVDDFLREQENVQPGHFWWKWRNGDT